MKEGPSLALLSGQEGGRSVMRKHFAVILIIATGFITASCCSTGYNTQRGAAIGGALGALAGQAIGRNTTGTLIGLAGGALLGAMVGNAEDQAQMYGGNNEYRTYPQASRPVGGYPEQSSGRWADVPGQRVGDRWVPSHRVWVPAHP